MYTKVGAVSAITGAILLFVGTSLHPMEADPNDPVAAFTEYAADSLWVASHLTQLLGIVLIVAALLTLTRLLTNDKGGGWSHLGSAFAIASLTIAAALQAVDGIALKVMVDNWVAAPESEKMAIFQATIGVRQIEVGLASMFSMLIGLTIVLYGVSIVISDRLSSWLGWIAIIGGGATVTAGVMYAYTGFSKAAMSVSMPAGMLLLIWLIVLGASMWRVSNKSDITPHS